MQLVSDPGAMQTPGGGYGFRFFDNEGRTVEVSSDVAVRAHRKIEEGESVPVRLSHVVVNSADPEATRAFYEQHLAFALSDTLMHPHMGDMMWFMRINAWHHSLAIARCPHPVAAPRLVRAARPRRVHARHRRLLRAGVEKIWGPGRHLAGNNTFSYFLDPHGNTVEYTTELEQVDEDTWHPHLTTSPSPRSPTSGAPPTDERVRRPQVVQRPGPRPVRRPAGLKGCRDAIRQHPATGGSRPGWSVRRRRAPPAGRRITVFDLVRSGLPAALTAGAARTQRVRPCR